MAVDKTIEIDLNKLTPQMLEKIDKNLEEVKNFFINPDTRTISQKTVDPLLIPKTQKTGFLEKIFGKSTFKNILNIGSNPGGFLLGGVTKLIPVIGTALAATGIFAALIKRVDDFQKAFVDNVDKRIDVFRSKEQQVFVQAGLTQLIITSASGSAEPRDAYNTFDEFNTNQSRIEADFKLRDTAGVD